MDRERKQLECRIVLTHGHRADLKTEVGMFDPISGRYEPLGAHGDPTRAGQRELDRVVRDLKGSMERAGHLVTFSERRGPR